jgi:tetratricopeptide (TPR) repeat protein
MAAVAPLLTLPPVTTLTLVRDEVADALTQAEALVAANKHDEAVVALESLWPNVRSDQALALRQRLALSWSEMALGNLEQAAGLLEQAEGIVRAPRFDASDRADVLFRHGCVAFQLGNVAEAINELTGAIEMNAHSPLPRPLVAANAHEWRSRCNQFRRDWDAAGSDAERALEISLRIADEPAQARALFQASLVAERKRDWLVARVNAEQALELFRKQGNTLAVARILNNLGGIDFLLGDVAAAEKSLLEAASTAAEAGSDADIAQSTSSLAQVYLRTDRLDAARTHAHAALDLLAGRVDFLEEIGNAQLVVAKSHAAEQDAAAATAWLDRAEQTFTQLDSTSHLAAVCVARGDLARTLGEEHEAADYYRRAAESLQDFHF